MAKGAKTYLAKAKSWAARNGLHGSAAFSKYVMLTYMEHLCSESNEFVFKGGNLLWVSIRKRPIIFIIMLDLTIFFKEFGLSEFIDQFISWVSKSEV